MCGENVRDGSTTKTIPLDQEDCADTNCTTDSEFGMHENYMHYYQCKNRERNHRLFTSTQKLKAGILFYCLKKVSKWKYTCIRSILNHSQICVTGLTDQLFSFLLQL